MASKRMLLVASGAIASALALAPAAFAAHAGAPYTNVDHSNDMGNDTGDSQVEGLNSQQLNQNYQGPVQLRSPSATNPTPLAPVVGATAPPPPGPPPQ
jgi:hypothetical protein